MLDAAIRIKAREQFELIALIGAAMAKTGDNRMMVLNLAETAYAYDEESMVKAFAAIQGQQT